MNNIESKQLLATLVTAAKICGYEVIDPPESPTQSYTGNLKHIYVKAKNATITFPFMPQVRLHQAMTVARHMGLTITTKGDDMTIVAKDKRTVIQPFTEFNYTHQLCSGIMTLVYWSQKNANRLPETKSDNPS